MEALETIQARHRKEQRDLQSRITSKKKNATKKTRKGVNDECAELERQLRERQARELAAALNDGGEGETGEEEDGGGEENEKRDGVIEGGADAIATRLKDTSLASPVLPASPQPNPITTQPNQRQQIGGASMAGRTAAEVAEGGGGKKRNRQKERLARRAAEVEAAAEAAEAEAANMTDHRAMEKTQLERAFAAHGLVEREIRPDGHCLFAAVADQLEEKGVPILSSPSSPASTTKTTAGAAGDPGYKIVRRRATDYMEAHPDDFAPFLEEPLADYVPKMRDTAEWGGQLELAALASAYGVEIKVVQGDGRTETIEPAPAGGGGDGGGAAVPGKGRERERERIWLAYYRHGYGLGEHYNSLRRKKAG